MAGSRAGIIVAIAVLVGAGVAVGAYMLASGPEEVEVVRVETREVVELYVATGELKARHHSEIGPEIGGVVDALAVDSGERVTRGVVLAELRPQDAKMAIDKAQARVQTLTDELQQARSGPTAAQLDAARAGVHGAAASLAQAGRELERAERLHAQGLITDAELDRARAAQEQAVSQQERAQAELRRLRELPRPQAVQVARSRLDQARLDLKEARETLAKTSLRAPFDGLVVAVRADPGERVQAGQTVVEVADMSTVEVYAEIDEAFFGRLESGQPATLLFPSLPDERYRAEVRRLGPEADRDRGIIGVHLEPEALPEAAFPGLTVDVNVEVARLPEASAVPQEAIIEQDARAWVLAIEGERAVRVPVEILARGESWTAIAPNAALDQGELLVREAAKIAPGQAVRAAGGE